MWISEYMKKEQLVSYVATGIIATIVLTISLTGETSDKDVSHDNKRELKDVEHYINDEDLHQDAIMEEQRQIKKHDDYVAYIKYVEWQEQLRKQEVERLAKIEAEKKAKEQKAKKSTSALSSGSDLGTFEATYYSPNCGGCSGYTKLEFDVRNTIYYQGMRVIAVDPNVIPLWSIVEVTTPHETFKAIAGDVGGGIKHRRVDILVSNTSTAYELGRHNVTIKLIRKGKGE